MKMLLSVFLFVDILSIFNFSTLLSPPLRFPSTKAFFGLLSAHLRPNEISWVLIKDRACALSKRTRERRMLRCFLSSGSSLPSVSVSLPFFCLWVSSWTYFKYTLLYSVLSGSVDEKLAYPHDDCFLNRVLSQFYFSISHLSTILWILCFSLGDIFVPHDSHSWKHFLLTPPLWGISQEVV